MNDKLLTLWIRFRHDDEGVTLVEYGIAVGLAVMVGGVLLGVLAGGINTNLNLANDAMTIPTP
jgi:pilus assembly protein Flp/PilA